MPKLTKRFLDDLKPGPAGSDQTHWDDSLKGFGVRVRASGAMSWVIMYRNRDNRLRKYTIGQAGALTPDEARNEARQKLADAHRGLDPCADKGAQRSAMTVAILCDQYQEHSKGRIKDSTWNMNQSRIDCHIKPLLGSRKTESLKLADIESLQRDVASGKSAKATKRQGRGGTTRGGRGVAARTVSMLGTILEYARRQGLVTSNVARGVQKYAIGKRTRFLSYEEIAELGNTMKVAAEHGENKTALAAITALALTGCRRQEILDLPWDWLDGQRRCIRFADTKTGPNCVRSAKPPSHISWRKRKLKTATGSFLPAVAKAALSVSPAYFNAFALRLKLRMSRFIRYGIPSHRSPPILDIPSLQLRDCSAIAVLA